MSEPARALRPRAVPEGSLAGGARALSPLLERIFLSRGVRDAAELDLSLTALASPDQLPAIDRAAARLAAALRNDEHVLIGGDFDADGATAVALSVSLLEALGARRVSYLVPNRFEFGYGLSPEIVELALESAPQVIVTVDNGVSSIEGVALAQSRGVDVIVTDHHLPGAELPAAHSIVNPNLEGSTFPSPAMAGVGVAYYLLTRLRARLAAEGWFDETSGGLRPTPKLADWLDLVALGTVADVVPLDHNNRVLVEQGLRRMRAGRCRPGIKALCQLAGRDQRRLTATDLAFALGPRLNAAGRLDDMTLGIRCLLAKTDEEARALAVALDELNRARRELEQEMVSEAELIVVEQARAVGDHVGITVYDPAWHQGVVGIVAGRLKDRLHRPVIAFAEAGAAAPDELKGSARSLPELHMRDLLDRIATNYPGLLTRFGGHAMAAGLSLKRVHYPRFQKIFDRLAREQLSADALSPTLDTDGPLDANELTLATAQALEAAGPWGQQFPEPLFQGEFDVVTQRVVGEQHLKLVVKSGDRVLDAIAFRQPPVDATRVLLAYRLGLNDYRDAVTLQLVVEHVAPLT